MSRITKDELIEFIKKNCCIDSSGNVNWSWTDDAGSQSSKEINRNIKRILEDKNAKNNKI